MSVNKFSTDLPTLRKQLEQVLPKPHVLKHALDMESIIADLITIIVWLGILVIAVIILFQGFLFFGFLE